MLLLVDTRNAAETGVVANDAHVIRVRKDFPPSHGPVASFSLG